jgi:hypothetical protein
MSTSSRRWLWTLMAPKPRLGFARRVTFSSVMPATSSRHCWQQTGVAVATTGHDVPAPRLAARFITPLTALIGWSNCH